MFVLGFPLFVNTTAVVHVYFFGTCAYHFYRLFSDADRGRFPQLLLTVPFHDHRSSQSALVFSRYWVLPSMPDSSPDRQGPILGAVLGVVGLLLLVGIVFITKRKRRRRQPGDTEKTSGPFHGTALLDKQHPATKIMPFGTSLEDHYFRA